MKFYVVWQGRETGIFTSWEECKPQIEDYKGAQYKSFKTREEAEQAFMHSYFAAINNSSFYKKEHCSRCRLQWESRRYGVSWSKCVQW